MARNSESNVVFSETAKESSMTNNFEEFKHRLELEKNNPQEFKKLSFSKHDKVTNSMERFSSQSKFLYHMDKIDEYLKTGQTTPVTFEIDPTNKCNLNCWFCIWGDFRNDVAGYLSKEHLMKIVSDCADMGVRSIIWTGGGDPLMNQYTLDAVEYSKSLGIKNGMFTNAGLLVGERADRVIKNIEWLRINFVAPTREEYKKVHQVDIFDKVCENLRSFVARRIEINGKKKPSIGMGGMFEPSNYSGLADVARLAKSLGLDFFQAKHRIQLILDKKYTDWWTETLIPAMKELRMELEDPTFKLQVADEDYTIDTESKKCHIHFFASTITADGDVAYCKQLRDEPKFYLGNIKEKSLKEIWSGERHKELNKYITPGNCGVYCPYKRINRQLELIKETPENSHMDFL